jgi:hypothetical protein
MPRHSSQLLELAKRGAEQRLRELAHEVKNLFAVFPHLHDSFDADELPVKFILAEGARRGAAAPVRRRGRMSPAARRAASERMKNYWARRKAQKS